MTAVLFAAMAAPPPHALAAGDGKVAIESAADGVRVPIGEGLTVILPARIAARADSLAAAGTPELRRRMTELLRRSAAGDPAMAAALGRYLAERLPARARTIRRTVRRFTRAGGAFPDGRRQPGASAFENRQPALAAGGAVAEAASGSVDSGALLSGATVGGRAPAPRQTLLSSPGVTIQAPASRVASPTLP